MTDDSNDIIEQRRARLEQLRVAGNAYPNDFRRNILAADLHSRYGVMARDELEGASTEFCLAGRMMSRRVMGKVAFAHIRDMSGQIQLFIRRDALPDGVFAAFRKWDIGDIIGVSGAVFRTKTGELSLRVASLRLLAKSLRPLPEKFHGLADQETRYRRRYLDLLTNEATRQTFQTRSSVINQLRACLVEQEFLEVETPMMQPIPGGATARPFITHHNSLDMDLYLRIAPELYLKRLLVGGFEKVFEINRNFRNEGLSQQHNPEFTMLEFYWAFAGYEDLMTLTETMLRRLAMEIKGGHIVEYQGESYDLGQDFTRMTVQEAILAHNPQLTADELDDPARLRSINEALGVEVKQGYGIGKLQIELFEKTVEAKLRQPAFITGYPIEVSPLSRRNDNQPELADRFELFIGGREIANGFSELNDPDDQAARFRLQAEEKASGDEEAMHYDADYITALEYGMPPAAGEGIGIDRLVMLLTDSASIRDVILFPQLRTKG